MRMLMGAAALVSFTLAASPPPQPPARAATPGVAREATTASVDGTPVERFILTNASGVRVTAISYGGIITSWLTPDRSGTLADIVLGFDTEEAYVKSNPPFFGAIVGRYANRIAKGEFPIDGKPVKLETNSGPNHIHGGRKGFDKFLWRAEPTRSGAGPGVSFTRTSADGEQGYPGALSVKVTYVLTGKNELIVTYEATTDKPTIVNLSQHTYFNLAGEGTRDVLDHELRINADRLTPVDASLIPTGELLPVEGTPFDFRKPTTIGARIKSDHPQIAIGKGYDHNFVVARAGAGLSLAAEVYEPTSGRTLQVSTTEPGVQLYTGNFLNGSLLGKGGRAYRQHYGFCLETQHFPDSPNQPKFPSTMLRPGERYRSQTVFATGVRK